MNPPGHLAVAYLLSRRGAGRSVAPSRSLPTLGAIATGALLPDIIDKSAMLAGLTPYGRTIGHSLFLWACALLIWMVAKRRGLRGASALGGAVAGGISHIAVDLLDDVAEGLTWGGVVFSGWMGWPWTNPDMLGVRGVPHLFGPARNAVTALEVLTVLGAAVLSVHDRRSSRPRAR